MTDQALTTEQPATSRPEANRLRLRPSYLAISLVSVFVVIGSDWLINEFGWPSATDLPKTDPKAGSPESTARVAIVTMLMLLIGAAALGFWHFIRLFLKLDDYSRLRVAATFCLLILSVLIYFQANRDNPPVEAQELTGQALFCQAAGLSPQLMLEPGAQPWTRGHRSKPAAAVPGNCVAPTYKQLRKMIRVQQFALGLAIPAMVLGAILTLARRRKKGDAAEDPELLKRQIGELNTILYLSAFILVCGLLFISAYHHYPAYALSDPELKQYSAHAKAVVLFYGVSFSLLILTFYLPAAGELARRAAAVPQPAEEKPISGGLLDTTQLLKIALAVLAPVITSILGGIVNVPGT